MLKGGYGQLVEDAATGLEILCEHPVDRIDYAGDAAVRRGAPLTADVRWSSPCRLPLAGKIAFAFKRPRHKQGPSRRIGYGGDGVLNKVTLLFDAPFWDTAETRQRSPDDIDQRGALNTWSGLLPFSTAAHAAGLHQRPDRGRLRPRRNGRRHCGPRADRLRPCSAAIPRGRGLPRHPLAERSLGAGQLLYTQCGHAAR
ncbi:MAG: FAD-dependent oxidoreductase [Caldilineaceae bacterium]